METRMRRRDFLSGGLGLLGASCGFSFPGRCDAAPSWSKDLADHRIVNFETFQSRDRYVRSLGPNAKRGPLGSGYSRPFRIATTDQGARGIGMCWPNEDSIKPFVGAKLGDLFDPSVGVTEEAHALDYVLHDLAGEILGKPVYELMGAHGPTEIDTYSGAIYMEDLMPQTEPRGVSAVLDACQMDYDFGYRAFKLKIGRARWMQGDQGDQRDIEATRAVREKFPDCKILVDANDGYTVDRFLKYVTGVADCDLFWIEEPFVENRDGLARLRDHMHKVGCRALIADGEARTGSAPELWKWGEYEKKFIDRFFRLTEERLIDVCVFDIGTLGFTRWRKVMPILKEAGVAAAPHLWGCTPKPLYCAHLAAGIGNVLIVEGIPGVGKNLDYSNFAIRDGKLCVPSVPGFGISRTKGAGIGLRKSVLK